MPLANDRVAETKDGAGCGTERWVMDGRFTAVCGKQALLKSVLQTVVDQGVGVLLERSE